MELCGCIGVKEDMRLLGIRRDLFLLEVSKLIVLFKDIFFELVMWDLVFLKFNVF